MPCERPVQRRQQFATVLVICSLSPAAFAQEKFPIERQETELGPFEPRPSPEPPLEELETPDEFFGVPIHGSFSFRYLFRNTSDESDHDVYGFLGLDFGDPEKHRVTAHILAKSAWDADGDIHTTGETTFVSLEDTYDSRFTLHLYEAYVDYHAKGAMDLVRFGRQILDETPVQTYLDGLRIDTEQSGPLSWKLGAYGGVPSHLYESSPQGDILLGAFSEARPFERTRARLDWMQVQDDYLSSERTNAMVRLALWQQLNDSLAMYGSYSLLDWDSRDFEVRTTWAPAESDLQFEVSYFQLLKTQQAEAIEFDPYFDIAGEYNPYRELRASASKGFGDHFSLSVGADLRRLVDDADEGEFNHDFERWYLSPSLIDWPIEGLTTTLTGELWDDGDEVISTGELDFTQELSEHTKFHFGTSYSLYKYDYLSMSERDHVRTYFVGIETRATKQLRLRIDYVHEDDAFDDYNTLRVAATWIF